MTLAKFKSSIYFLIIIVAVFAFAQTSFAAAPLVTTLSPLDDATEVAVDADLVIIFDQVVNVGVQTIQINRSSDDAIFDDYEVTASQITGTGTTTITLDLGQPFQSNTEYYVQIFADAFENVGNESYLGIVDTTSWTFTTSTTAYSGSGAGSIVDPYTITTCAELVEARAFLDSAFSLEPAGEATTLDCSANGNDVMIGGRLDIGYTSTFEGNDVTLTVDIDSTQDTIGLFRFLDGGTVNNLHLAGTVVGGEYYVGGMIGYADSSTISGSSVLADVTGGDYDIGGFVGHIEDSIITDSFATGNVDNIYVGGSYQGDMGGFAGHTENTDITDSYATGTVDAQGINTWYVGGFVGWMDGGTYTRTFATGDVTANDEQESIGGFAGYLDPGGFIYNSYATGNVLVDDSNDVGGFAGYAHNLLIEDSYATGTVTATDGEKFGGFIGFSDSSTIIKRSYATGSVDAAAGTIVGGFTGDSVENLIESAYAQGDVIGTDKVGGFIGDSSDESITYSYSTGLVTGAGEAGGFVADAEFSDLFTATYWDINTSGKSDGCSTGTCTGIFGKNTSQMKSNGTYDGWDFRNIWGINNVDNNGYPFLLGQGFDNNAVFSSARSSSGTTYGCKDKTASNYTQFASHKESMCEYDIETEEDYEEEGVETEPVVEVVETIVSSANEFTESEMCSAEQQLTQNLKSGAYNERYHSYTNDTVTEAHILQAQLNRLGFESGAEDGMLGPISDGAIKQMQEFLGTKIDGYVGPLTRALLNNSCEAAEEEVVVAEE